MSHRLNRLGKACFIQGLSNESILLSQAIELSEEESAILSAKEKSPSTATNGPHIRCSVCNRLGLAASKCMELSKFSPASVKAVLSCFICGHTGHVARDCRRRPTLNCNIGRDIGKVRDSRFKGSIGRDTDNEFGSGRDSF
jgi:hypothetical protein